MNKRILILLSLLLIAVIALCTVSVIRRKSADTVSKGTPGVFCTTYPVYLFTKAVMEGSSLQPQLLLPSNTGCPHDYALTPQDLMKLSGGNILLIQNGLGLDDPICRMAQQAEPGIRIVSATAGLDALDEDEEEECEAEEEHHHHAEKHHHHHGGKNAHLFASPDTAAGMVRNIVRELRAFDPVHAELYEKNGEAYVRRLQSLAGDFRNAGLQGKKIAVQHNVFDYLARLTGMKSEVSLHADESQVPSPAETMKIRKEIAGHGVTVLFGEPQYPKANAETIAKDCGIRYAVLDPCASGPENADGRYYVEVMQSNLRLLKEIFGK